MTNTDFWFGWNTLLAAIALVAVLCSATLVVARAAAFAFSRCRHGHRIELIRDQDDEHPETMTGTTWECLTCNRSWRVVKATERAEVPDTLHIAGTAR